MLKPGRKTLGSRLVTRQSKMSLMQVTARPQSGHRILTPVLGRMMTSVGQFTLNGVILLMAECLEEVFLRLKVFLQEDL